MFFGVGVCKKLIKGTIVNRAFVKEVIQMKDFTKDNDYYEQMIDEILKGENNNENKKDDN